MESQDSDLLFLDSRSEGTSNRCIVNFVGQDDSICVSPNMSCSENFITHKSNFSVKEFSDCAEFLTEFYKENLQYRTIAGV